MAKKLPEMLMRWHVVEQLLHDAIRRAQESGNWELGVRELDELLAATTGRGQSLSDGKTSEEFAQQVWASFQTKAEQLYPAERWVKHNAVM